MVPFVGIERQLVDLGPTTEIACSGLGRIEFMGSGQGCYVLYRNAVNHAGLLEPQICGRIFAPLAAAAEANELIASALVKGGLARSFEFPRRHLA